MGNATSDCVAGTTITVFGSKFVVLELVNLVFGSRVDLGGFVSVTLLIVVLLLARSAVRRLVQPEPLSPPPG